MIIKRRFFSNLILNPNSLTGFGSKNKTTGKVRKFDQNLGRNMASLMRDGKKELNSLQGNLLKSLKNGGDN